MLPANMGKKWIENKEIALGSLIKSSLAEK